MWKQFIANDSGLGYSQKEERLKINERAKSLPFKDQASVDRMIQETLKNDFEKHFAETKETF